MRNDDDIPDLPTPRQLNSPDPVRPEPGDDEDGESAGYRWRMFSEWLVGELEEFRVRCARARGRQFLFSEDPRLNKARLRASAKLDLVRNEKGDVDRSIGDGHAFAGITEGLCARSVKVAQSYVFRELFQSAERWFKVNPVVDKEGAQHVAETLESMMDYFLGKMDFDQKAYELCGDPPAFGTCLPMTEWVRPLKVKRRDGKWIEEVSEDVEPRINVVDPADVYVSNYDEPEAAKQRGVFYVFRGVTLQDLYPDECVLNMEVSKSVFGYEVNPVKRGRYYGLRMMRGADDEGLDLSDYASMFPTFDLFLYRGSVNLHEAIHNGSFTPRLAAEADVTFGIEYDEQAEAQPDGMEIDPEAEREFAESQKMEFERRASITPGFWAAYIAPSDYVGDETITERTDATLIGFGEMAETNPTGLYALKYFSVPHKFLGMNIHELGGALENMSDAILNGLSRIFALVSNPAKLVFQGASGFGVEGDFQKMFMPGEVTKVNVPPENAVKEIKPDYDPRMLDAAAFVRQLFESITGTGAAVKGEDNPTTKTLGEKQLDSAAQGAMLRDVMLGYHRELSRMLWDLVETYEAIAPWGEKPDGTEVPPLVKLAYRVAPRTAADFEKYYEMSGMDRMRDEFRIRHPATLTMDRAVAVNMYVQLLPLIMPFFPDGGRPLVERVLTLLGDTTLRAEMTEGTDAMPVPEQHAILASGNYIEPNENDPHLVEVPAHDQELQKVLMELAQGQREEMSGRLYAAHLDRHIKEHQAIFAKMIAEAGMGGMMGGPGMPGAAGPGLGSPVENAPADETRMATDMAAKANSVPNPGGPPVG